MNKTVRFILIIIALLPAFALRGQSDMLWKISCTPTATLIVVNSSACVGGVISSLALMTLFLLAAMRGLQSGEIYVGSGITYYKEDKTLAFPVTLSFCFLMVVFLALAVLAALLPFAPQVIANYVAHLSCMLSHSKF